MGGYLKRTRANLEVMLEHRLCEINSLDSDRVKLLKALRASQVILLGVKAGVSFPQDLLEQITSQNHKLFDEIS